MEVLVNYPLNKEDILDLRKRISHFRATLILQHIKKLEIDEDEKNNVLEAVKNTLKEKSKNEKIDNNKILRTKTSKF